MQAQYVKAPSAEEAYLKNNKFLPNINNEVPHDLSQQYKDNLMALDNLVLVRFKADSTGALPLPCPLPFMLMIAIPYIALETSFDTAIEVSQL